MKPLISVADFQKLNSKDIVIVDARSGKDAFDRYAKGHIEGAFHADLDRDLAAVPADPSKGGRHPLPEPVAFGALLGRLGIEPATHVIVYDDKSGSNAAARFWWMLKATGHERVQVLDGGVDAAVKAGLALSAVLPQVRPTSPYKVNWKDAAVTIDEVERAVKDPTRLVIDVREAYRYNGESEPIDTVAGHIPGAVNVPYVENLNADGTFLPADTLKAKYEAVLNGKKQDDVIVHCGSGVTACHTLLAMEQAGITKAKLYVGSWSEWSRTGRAVAKGAGNDKDRER